MKAKTYNRYFLRSLKKDLSKILSIVAIVALGVGFLIGLLSCTPNLYKSVNSYLKDVSYQDIILKSNVGFDTKTIEYLQENIEDIETINRKTEVEDTLFTENTSIYTHIVYQSIENNLSLVEGRMPSAKNECVILTSNPNLIDHLNEIFFYKEEKKVTYQIVGKVKDPTYISKEEIYSQINNKKIQMIIYLNNEFDNDYVSIDKITDISIGFKSLKNLNVFSDTYKKNIQNKTLAIEDILQKNNLSNLNYYYVLETNVQNELILQLKDLGYEEKIIDELLETEAIKNQIQEVVQKQYEETINTIQPQIFIITHDEIAALITFKSNAEKVNLISTIFPVFFFAIAMLVSLSSFSRIVFKDKLEIAVLRANGYPHSKIYQKYMLIGLFSVLLGCILGTIGGIFLLPYIIYQIYETMYALPSIQFTFQYFYIISISVLMMGLILLVIYMVVHRYIQKNISNLLVDNDIKNGKKILLEKIPFIWKHLKFKTKSMFRNVFRFKRNFIMMLLGVGGCSAILLTGFGLNDSLNVLTTNQFEDIFQYNLIIQTEESNLYDLEKQENIIYITNGKVNQNSEYSVYFIAASQQLNELITFKDSKKNKVVNFTDSSCFITQQIADKLHLQENDKITYTFNQRNYEFKIDKIVENYVGNYLYVGNHLIQKDEFTAYQAIMAYKDFNHINEEDWFTSLLENHSIKNIIYTNQNLKTYDSLINNLKGIVALLIFISGLLAIIVIYNLVDINMSERIKEMATLRVIGYKKKEVIMYIFREIFFMSLFGFLLGISFGLLLHRFIIHSIASPGLTFGIYIQPLSYLYTGLLTVLFSLIVVLIFSPKIIKINMSEALKAPE